MGKESAERIQTSILSKAEKKALVWLAQRQPEWMTSDTLTYIGVLGTAPGLCHRRLVVEYRYKIFVAFVVRTGTSLVRRQLGRHTGTLP